MKVYFNPYKQFRGCWIPDWLLCRSELSAGTKLCYSRLARFAGKNGYCYPKIETLAETLGVSVPQCKRYLKQLQDMELIESRQRGMGNSNQYYFLQHEWMTESVNDIHTLSDDTTGDIINDTTRSITFDTPEVSHMILPNKESHFNQNIERERTEKQVIDHLLKTFGNDFEIRPTGKYRKYIKQLIDEGKTIEQFKTVINRREKDYRAGAIQQYLVEPDVLFKPDLFTKELNAAKAKKVNKTKCQNNGAKVTTDSKKWDDVKSL